MDAWIIAALATPFMALTWALAWTKDPFWVDAKNFTFANVGFMAFLSCLSRWQMRYGDVWALAAMGCALVGAYFCMQLSFWPKERFLKQFWVMARRHG